MELILAKQVAERIRRCAELLSISVTLVKPHLSDRELATYTLRVGKVVGEMGFAVLFPIYGHYPQLKPEPTQRANVENVENTEIPADSAKVAEIVRNMSKKIQTELLDVLKTVEQKADPHEATGFAQRIQAVLELVKEVQV